MKPQRSYSLVAALFSFIVATACCWIPWLAVLIGGTTGLIGVQDGLNNISMPFLLLGVLLLVYGIYQLFLKKPKPTAIILDSTIRCPHCDHIKTEKMPTDACQFFYKCDNCKTILKPKKNDCCVYCSYGSVPCPPVQQDVDCCK